MMLDVFLSTKPLVSWSTAHFGINFSMGLRWRRRSVQSRSSWWRYFKYFELSKPKTESDESRQTRLSSSRRVNIIA
jgi:hypothetical protein